MISRRSAKAIADAYAEAYVHVSSAGPGHSAKVTYYVDELYDFLFLNDFDGWFMNKFKLLRSWNDRALPEFIMKLHTGESIVENTAKWSHEQRATLGQRLLRELAEALIRDRHTNSQFETYGNDKKKTVDAMQRTLELDGYVYRDGVLYVPEESVVDVREEEGVLESLVGRAELSDVATIKHHLVLTAEHYQAQRWDDSIANARKVLEAVLQQVATKHALSKGVPLATQDLEKPVIVRDYLETSGLLDKKEKEAVAKTYGLLSDTGGHPHIAERDQARLMRHLALTFSQFVLLRYLAM